MWKFVKSLCFFAIWIFSWRRIKPSMTRLSLYVMKTVSLVIKLFNFIWTIEIYTNKGNFGLHIFFFWLTFLSIYLFKSNIFKEWRKSSVWTVKHEIQRSSFTTMLNCLSYSSILALPIWFWLEKNLKSFLVWQYKSTCQPPFCFSLLALWQYKNYYQNKKYSWSVFINIVGD